MNYESSRLFSHWRRDTYCAIFSDTTTSGALSARPLRVAYFAGTMRPEHDGVTRVLYRLIGYLNEQKIENKFFSPIVPAPNEQPTQFHKIPSVTFPLYRDYQFAMPGIRHFSEELLAFNPDIIHINSPCPLGYAAVKFGRRHHVPVVATYHTHFASYAKYYHMSMLAGLSWKYIRSLYNDCERVFVPSRPILDELAAHGLNTLEFLPHGVDTNAFNPQAYSGEWKKRIGAERKLVLLFAGRLVWEKDLKTLAQAYALLTAKRNDVAFVLAGDGPVREELTRMMPKAIFLGHQSKHSLATAYASSDVFVFPSTTETFGNVTLEAMAAGLPPVCARAGGAYGIIEPERTGLLAEPRCPHDLVEKIGSLLDHPEKRSAIRSAALSFARTQQWENIFDRMIGCYEQTIRECSHLLGAVEHHPASLYFHPQLESAQ